MRAPRPDRTIVRAAIAVVALYALVLQAVLGAALPIGTPDPAHVLCLTDTGGDGPSAPGSRHHHALPCCTPACGLVALPAAPEAAAAVAWPARPALVVAWRRAASAMPRAPPAYRANARAPPVA